MSEESSISMYQEDSQHQQGSARKKKQRWDERESSIFKKCKKIFI